MKNDELLKEKQISSESIYKGKIIDVYKDKVICPNGHESTRELIRHCKASCIMAFTSDNKLLIERQYRYPYDEVIYEFPAGKCDKDEDPLVTAKRELEEETGYYANNIVYLGKMYPSCAYTDEVIYLYLATSLEKRKQHLDENEALNIFEMSLDEVIKLVKSGEIKDAKTLCALTYYFTLNK
ncbi:MAG: NUDIX hydrolase [Firmicutes bacterium]|uniref:NUDIX hydrolase n=1 Tax=Candidatus Onthovivens merdipullorum TaxID=2840889 RepID=A0A9D9GWQ8_9BACL|nr:NUDIX hydrolase [Candidatus Onthovivens merdipullorum]